MSAEAPYDDAISRLNGSQTSATTSDGNNADPVYSHAVEFHQTGQSKYNEGGIDQSKESEESGDYLLNYNENDIIEALQVCEEVDNAVADENVDATETPTGENDMSDPVYQDAEDNWSTQYDKKRDNGDIVSHDYSKYGGKFGSNDFSKTVYRGSKVEDNEMLKNMDRDMQEPIYRRNGDVITNEVVVFDTDMVDPVYHDANDHFTDDLKEVQLRPASVARRKSGEAENVYSFAKDTNSVHVSDLINKRHGIHGEKSLSVHGDLTDLSAPATGSADQNLEGNENLYMSLKDVVSAEDILKVESQKDSQTAADTSQTRTSTVIDDTYEFVDYAKPKKTKKGQRHEAIVTKKSRAQESKKTPALAVSEGERKTAKQKSKALKRSGKILDWILMFLYWLQGLL